MTSRAYARRVDVGRCRRCDAVGAGRCREVDVGAAIRCRHVRCASSRVAVTRRSGERRCRGCRGCRRRDVGAPCRLGACRRSRADAAMRQARRCRRSRLQPGDAVRAVDVGAVVPARASRRARYLGRRCRRRGRCLPRRDAVGAVDVGAVDGRVVMSARSMSARSWRAVDVGAVDVGAVDAGARDAGARDIRWRCRRRGRVCDTGMTVASWRPAMRSARRCRVAVERLEDDAVFAVDDVLRSMSASRGDVARTNIDGSLARFAGCAATSH